jgi:hypothetical protein
MLSRKGIAVRELRQRPDDRAGVGFGAMCEVTLHGREPLFVQAVHRRGEAGRVEAGQRSSSPLRQGGVENRPRGGGAESA